MRTRLFGLAAALFATGTGMAQQPAAPAPAPPVAAAPAAQPPAGMTPLPAIPVAPAPAPAVAHPAPGPIVVQAPPGCGTPAPAPAADCNTCAPKSRGLLDRLGIGCGTASPVSCGTLASERTFVFGSCRQFYTPCRGCGGQAIEYGNGGLYNKDFCKGLGSFNSR